MESFIAALTEMRGEQNLILCHEHADSDAIGAAYAVSRWIGADIGVPTTIASHARQLVGKLGIQVLENPNPSQYTHVILVDCANAVQLGSCMPNKYWLIDHHADNNLFRNAVDGLYDAKSSTCQLVYRLLKQAQMVPDQLTAIALCAGILTDTINFHKGDEEAFQVFGELLQLGQITYEEIQDLYGVHQRQDRGAIIDAALNARKYSFDGFHILVTEIDRNIPTFAARALFDLGADISIVGFQHDGDVEIRMYMRQEMADIYKMHADELLRQAVGAVNAKIWGYQLFAGYKSTGQLRPVLDRIIAMIQKQIPENA